MTHLVASAVPSLAPKDVSITDGNGTLLTSDGSSTGKTQATRNAYEDELSAQVTSMFDTLLGPGHAVVRVSAQMDTSSTTVDSQTYDPKNAVVLSESNSTETYAPGSSTTASGPVTSTNATGALPSGSSAAGTNGYSKTESSATRGVSVTTSHQVKEPGGVKRLTVAVAVDSNAKNAPSPEDVKAMVSGAVGLDPSRGDSISVTTPAFLVADGKAADEGSGASSSPVQKVQDYGPKALGTLLLLLVGLGFFRAVKTGTSTELSSAEVNAAVAAGRRSALPAGSVPAQRPGEDPLGAIEGRSDEVAGVLRGWLETTGSR
jgi:flagellar M-ring protein FliF